MLRKVYSNDKENIVSFFNSHLSWLTKKEKSFGRFAVEASCRIENYQCKYTETFFLSNSVMAGNLYDEDQLAKIPAYSFQIAASKDNYCIFRDYNTSKDNSDTFGRIDDVFSEMLFDIKESPGRKVSKMNDMAAITKAGFSLNGIVRFEYCHNSITLQFPVKHINICSDNQRFQVETGPILLPLNFLTDTHSLLETQCGSLVRAYIFFNRFDRAEFILKSIIETNRFCIRGYADVRKAKVKISLFTQIDALC